MDAYKRDIVVVIKIRAYIDGSLFVWMPDFTVAFSITTQAGVDPGFSKSGDRYMVMDMLRDLAW